MLLLFLVQGVFFAFIAWHRFVDGDEGFYLLASRLVLMHKRPYLDFFYTQAPLLPYAYALWMKAFGVSWLSAKLFSALLTAALGTLLCTEVLRHTRNWLAGITVVILFATSTLIFGFYPVAKTYSLTCLFLFAAYMLVARTSNSSSPWLAAAAGLLFGLGVSTRSYVVLVLPVLLWWMVRNAARPLRLKYAAAFLAGVLVGILPCLYLFLLSPRAFLFNNLGYHAMRSGGGLIGMWTQKVFCLLEAFLGGLEGNGLQTSLAFFVSLGLLMFMPKVRYTPRLAFQIAIALGLVSLLPTPVHPQYFCLCTPFLLLAAVCAVSDYLAELQDKRGKRLAAIVCALVVASYIAVSVPDFYRYLVGGDGVVEPGLAADSMLQHVLAVSRAIDEVASPGEQVASFWPGFIFQTKTTPYPGLENDFGLPIANQLSPERRMKYHVLTRAEIEADFAAHKPRVVVIRDHVSVPTDVEYRQKVRLLEDLLRKSLESQGYTVSRRIGDISIYVCRSSPS